MTGSILTGSTLAEGSMDTQSFTEPYIATYANLASLRVCSVLQNRPAVWVVKRKNMALSNLAAAVLTKEGLLEAKDLQL